MERDFTLIMRILAYVAETQTTLTQQLRIPQIPSYTPDEVQYHVGLCQQAGYLDANFVGASVSEFTHISRLTWAGHEKLDELRARFA